MRPEIAAIGDRIAGGITRDVDGTTPMHDREVLWGEVERLRLALREIESIPPRDVSDPWTRKLLGEIRAVARAALGGET